MEQNFSCEIESIKIKFALNGSCAITTTTQTVTMETLTLSSLIS